MKSLMLGAALAVALGGAAAAQDRPAGRADQNGDRRISLSEMQASAAQRFARLDVNRDGGLTREERRAGRQVTRAARAERRAGRQTAVFARRDADGNGVLSQAEAPRRLQTHFAHFDANRDGGLSAAELQAGRQAMAAQRRADRPARAQARPEGRVRADANGDRVISLAEMQARVTARFARLDGNRDGFVTRDERRAARAARRG